MPLHSAPRVMDKPPVYNGFRGKIAKPRQSSKCLNDAERVRGASVSRRRSPHRKTDGDETRHKRLLRKEERDIMIERSVSMNELHQLDDIKRSLSASNLMALSDPNLSLTLALPHRSYDDDDSTQFAKNRLSLTSNVHAYYHQLTEGCGNKQCNNLFCASNCKVPKRSNAAAGLISLELANRGSIHICNKKSTFSFKVFPPNLFRNPSCIAKVQKTTFVERIYTATPFKCLFLESPMSASAKLRRNGTLTTSQSYSCLQLSSSVDGGTELSRAEQPTSANTSVVPRSIQSLWKICTTLRSFLSASSIGSANVPTITEAVGPTKQLFGPEVSVTTCDTVNLQSFEAKVTQEINSSHRIAEEALSLSHLTFALLTDVVNDFIHCRDPTFLCNTLRTVFSSSGHLSLSFLDANDKLSCEDFTKCFKLLQEQDTIDYGFINTLTSSLEMLLFSLSQLPVVNAKEANTIAVAMVIPGLSNMAALSRTICRVIHRLSADGRQNLIFLLGALELSKLLDVQQDFQVLFSAGLTKGQLFESYHSDICSVLCILFDACVSHPQCSLVALQKFYNPTLSITFDLKADFASYMQGIKRGSHGSKDKSSFFDYPFLLEPVTKIKAIHLHAMNQMRAEYSHAIVQQARVQKVQKVLDMNSQKKLLSGDVYSAMCPYLLLELRRSHLVEDALVQLHAKAGEFKKPLKVKYVSGGEFGLDMGGLQKEFFQLAVEQLFAPEFGMFVSCDENQLSWVNKASLESRVLFEFVGVLLGLAIYNGITLDVHFPMAFYQKLLGVSLSLVDLNDVEPSIARSLQQLLAYEAESVDELGMTFQVSSTCLGEVVTHDLIPEGGDVLVTASNRDLFVKLYVNYLLDSSIKTQFNAIASGLHQVCDVEVFKLFRADELELLICGSAELDFVGLEQATIYRDSYSADHRVIIDFWKIVHAFTKEQKCGLLMFATGSARVPLNGLKSLAFHIQRNGPDTDNLPTAMTCFNRLLLPEYSDAEKLKAKLSLAIENSKGFGLT